MVGLHGAQNLSCGKNHGAFSYFRWLKLEAKKTDPPLCPVGRMACNSYPYEGVAILKYLHLILSVTTIKKMPAASITRCFMIGAR